MSKVLGNVPLIVLGMVAIAGYGLGSGWIQLGPPRQPPSVPVPLTPTPPPGVLAHTAPAVGIDPEVRQAVGVSPAWPAVAAQGQGRNPPGPPPRSEITGAQVRVTYTIPGADPRPLESQAAPEILWDGPELKFELEVDLKEVDSDGKLLYDDSGAHVTAELTPSGYRPFTPMVAEATGTPTRMTGRESAFRESALLKLVATESGTFNLTITMDRRRVGPPLVYRFPSPIRIRPDRVSSYPRLLKVVQDPGGGKVESPARDPSLPIEVGTGSLALVATTADPNRRLLAVDAGQMMPLRLGTSLAQTTSDERTNLPLEIPAQIDRVTLIDRPTRLAVIDRWTRLASNEITVVIPSQGVLGRTAGVNPTGVNAVFPEFTPPRTNPNGFEPSDKVETRVVQLYYYREAHRVAQIVNREVRSYNRVAVDTRRRLAERSRGEANAATADRRLQEVQAERAAREARATEVNFRRSQEALTQAIQAEADAKSNQDSATQALKVAEQGVTDLEERVGLDTTQIRQIDEELATLRPGATPAASQKIKDLEDQKADLATQLRGDQSMLIVARSRKVDLSNSKNQLSTGIVGLTTVTQARQAEFEEAQRRLEVRRDEEAARSDQNIRLSSQEDILRENEFRQEVAAAHEDPDTYVPGDPLSPDPVLQVSVSVIGEGLIQLRGPIKGINIIRMMINQIDSPVSQVRVGIHTVQINGERGDRMEKVATKIQDYVDHSRFLTSQSAQLLRNAVVKVASRKAVESARQCSAAGDTSQAARDAKYQESFFGVDFINELREIDSEFLMTGNKLLSLHSMDTTSLASALFLLALAKNTVRVEILDEFQLALMTTLPEAEANYYQAGAVGRPKQAHHKKDDFKMMACNAKFQSFLGFFNADVEGADTLNPLQREFLKLAQIFKSRLVVELEYGQRVRERGLIEQRLGNYLDELRIQADLDRLSEEELQTARADLSTRLQNLAESIGDISLLIDRDQRHAEVARLANSSLDTLSTMIKAGVAAGNDKPVPDPTRSGKSWNVLKNNDVINIQSGDRNQLETLKSDLTKKTLLPGFDDRKTRTLASNLDKFAENLNVSRDGGGYTLAFDRLKLNNLDDLIADTSRQLAIKKESASRLSELRYNLENSIRQLTGVRLDDQDVLPILFNILSSIGEVNRILSDESSEADASTQVKASADKFASVQERLRGAFGQAVRVIFARRGREESRQPLDHRRLLDMLIADVEEKYIELLEGTRAHTANIDSYLKTIATALDDDFNTQFYYPTFTEVRQASRFHDVSLGKIETTNVLANNRGFGKVSPQATMEFDLPKRDILINEAMNGALAMTKDFGALVADPNFLAMSALRSGQPTSSLIPGGSFGVNTERNVIAGLPRSNDERLLSQQGAGRTQFGAGMEALIPDPAVYKFETGTGFEIRPVVQPDGQSVVFHFNYMYTTNVREPVRADEKHLGRVKRHFIDTDVQLGNYELREVSRYQVALKASRTSRGVPLFEDIPGLGVLFRPLPSAESSLQENIVLASGTIFPTLFDLMGLRWAPAVADIDTLRLRNDNFVVRNRARDIENHVFDVSSARVDESLRIRESERRPDLYRSQQSIPDVHPDGYRGPGLNYRDSRLREGYDPARLNPEGGYIPEDSRGAYDTPPPPPLPTPTEYPGEFHVETPPGGPARPVEPPSSPTRLGSRGAGMGRPAPRPGATSAPTASPAARRPSPPADPGPELEVPTTSARPTGDRAVMPARATRPPASPGLPPLPADPATPKAPARRGLLSRIRGQGP